MTLHWSDHGYRYSDPKLERVEGPAILEVPLFTPRDHVDVLCGRSGHLLHASEASKMFRA